MKLITKTILLFMLTFNAHASDIVCAAAYPEVHQDYPKFVCKADRLLNEGEFKKAEIGYLEAAELPFFESPNFEIYLRVARAQCFDRRFQVCRKTLANFEQMVDVYVGKVSCEFLKRKPSMSTMKSIRVMCGELLENTYSSNSNDEIQSTTNSYRKQIAQLRRLIPR